MNFSLHRLRSIAWIALFAVLIGALAPTVSRVLAAGEGGWVEVCSAGGVLYLPAEGDPASDEDAPQHLSAAACAYCFTHAGSFGLAPVAATFKGASADRFDFIPAAPPRAVALAAYGISSPRAPPALA